MNNVELLNKIIKKAIYRYKNISIERAWLYISYAIRRYNLNYTQYNYIYKIFNKYIKKNPVENIIEMNFTINGKIC